MTGCQAHRLHAPRNRTVEQHHVIPVAWQLFWAPAAPPFPGPDPDGRGELWDNRTVTLCPTGHRNTHFWIVRMMRAIADGQPVRPGRGPEAGIAQLALARWTGAGGMLTALTGHGLWGEA